MSAALERLAELAQRESEASGLRRQLNVAEQNRAEAERRLDAAIAAHAKESFDVERLRSLSMPRILSALKGNRDLDLNREEAEAAAAAYQAQEAEARLEAARREVEDLDRRIATLGDFSAQRAEILQERERELSASASPAAAELTALAEQVGLTRAELAQIQEADVACRSAYSALNAAAEHLGSAQSWATYDTFFSGGVFSDMMKYDRLDKAGDLMRRADQALTALASELADVGIGSVGQIEITQMNRTFDVWFDNIFSDYAVRERIKEAAARVQQLQAGLSTTGDELARRKAAAQRALADAEVQRERLLTSS